MPASTFPAKPRPLWRRVGFRPTWSPAKLGLKPFVDQFIAPVDQPPPKAKHSLWQQKIPRKRRMMAQVTVMPFLAPGPPPPPPGGIPTGNERVVPRPGWLKKGTFRAKWHPRAVTGTLAVSVIPPAVPPPLIRLQRRRPRWRRLARRLLAQRRNQIAALTAIQPPTQTGVSRPWRYVPTPGKAKGGVFRPRWHPHPVLRAGALFLAQLTPPPIRRRLPRFSFRKKPLPPLKRPQARPPAPIVTIYAPPLRKRPYWRRKPFFRLRQRRRTVPPQILSIPSPPPPLRRPIQVRLRLPRARSPLAVLTQKIIGLRRSFYRVALLQIQSVGQTFVLFVAPDAVLQKPARIRQAATDAVLIGGSLPGAAPIQQDRTSKIIDIQIR